MLCGFNGDLTLEATATSNRIRGLFTHIHLAMERVVGKHLDHLEILDLLAQTSTSARQCTIGNTRVETQLRKHAPRAWKPWTAEIFAALGEQSAVVPGTEVAGTALGHQTRSLAHTETAQAEVLTHIEDHVEEHPLHELLISMPGSRQRQRPGSSPRSSVRISSAPDT